MAHINFIVLEVEIRVLRGVKSDEVKYEIRDISSV